MENIQGLKNAVVRGQNRSKSGRIIHWDFVKCTGNARKTDAGTQFQVTGEQTNKDGTPRKYWLTVDGRGEFSGDILHNAGTAKFDHGKLVAGDPIKA